ncbi:lysozyme inhibitor LprI family protein [Pseudomonas sp. 6D_7.1_Bac1]|uniref:lysozyme inhibitor LprI family protein n=1 Tax=Pseudomonas sp. 6D_7.1_Bac1 TaxID=2971615 RepID=UPI0021CABB8E|nr:hypothetical protein [Pseudomonas sp. 6D_7.1_Bac1]MCU1749387.1 hypothetical protein [Pseudomonas sp. 6D_7.1_Bac1]
MKVSNFFTAGIAFVALFLFDSYAQSAGFDCGKASTEMEKKICDTPSLSTLDEQLSAVFKPLKNRRTFQVIESDWLASIRNTCESTECLEDAYDQQIRFLTPLPEVVSVTGKDIKLLPENKAYTQYDRSWKTVELAGLPNEKNVAERFILSAETLSGMLYVIAFEGYYDVTMACYRGSLYEYVDKSPMAQPIVHTIAKNIGFDGAIDLGSNDDGKRFAGIFDGAFYYRQQITKNLIKGMVYKLGSSAEPAESSLLFQQWSNTNENARGGLLFSGSDMFSQLKIYYSHTPGFEIVAPTNMPAIGWNIFNPIWSKPRPVFYFKNGDETIWRANVVDKTLAKIVDANDHAVIQNPTPVEVNGREAIVYLEGSMLKIAIAPDE